MEKRRRGTFGKHARLNPTHKTRRGIPGFSGAHSRGNESGLRLRHMLHLFSRCSAVLGLLACVAPAAQADDAAASALADAVMKAHGNDAWKQVKTIKFTFVVGEAGKTEPLLEAKHVWEIAAGRDTVTWKGKTVTVNLYDPASSAEGDAKAAYARWTNDAYWLLAPFKLKDEGTKLASGPKQTVEGKEYEVLELAFQSVGLTPGDRYTLFIDPATKLLARWEYRPNAEKTITSGWSEYKDIGGMKLSTFHPFMDKTLRFTDISVER